jgi:hypothetical protein
MGISQSSPVDRSDNPQWNPSARARKRAISHRHRKQEQTTEETAAQLLHNRNVNSKSAPSASSSTGRSSQTTIQSLNDTTVSKTNRVSQGAVNAGQLQDAFISSQPISQTISPNTSRFGFTSLESNGSPQTTDHISDNPSATTQEEINAKALEKYPETSFSFTGIYHGARRWAEGAEPATQEGETATSVIKTGAGVATFAATAIGAVTTVPAGISHLATACSLTSAAISVQQGNNLGAAASLATMLPSGTNMLVQAANNEISLTTALAGTACRTSRVMGASYALADTLSGATEGRGSALDAISIGEAVLTVANR